MVATCDEFFLSHALDKHATLKKQAFVFVDGGGEVDSDSKHARLEYRPAVQSDIPALRAIKNSIIDDPQEQIDKREVHVGYLGDELAAIGLIIPSSLWPDRASIGMLTQESLRRKGIGTKTILYLKRVCRDSGIMPLAGCGYGNTNSRMTLQAAGMVTQTRLLRLTF